MLPKRMSPAFGALANARNVVQHPANLQAAEISGQRQAGLGAKPVGSAVARQFGNVGVNPSVLPDQCVVDRLPGLAIPEHRGLTLVGDADRRQVAGPKPFLLHGRFDHFFGPPPDLAGVVLHPSGLRKDLLVFFLGYRDNPPRAVKHDEPSAGSPLIDGSDISRHCL